MREIVNNSNNNINILLLTVNIGGLGLNSKYFVKRIGDQSNENGNDAKYDEDNDNECDYIN